MRTLASFAFAVLLSGASSAVSPRALAAQTPDSSKVDTAAAPAPRIRTRANWLADGRAELHVGDILTVRLDERTVASAVKRQNASDRRQRNLDVALVTPSGGGPSANVASSNQSSSNQNGDAAREISLSTSITVRVAEIDERGNARLEGTRTLDVDKNEQVLTVTGWVRPQDIPVSNVIDSQRLADAEIRASVKGPLGKPSGGILGRIFGAIWP